MTKVTVLCRTKKPEIESTLNSFHKKMLSIILKYNTNRNNIIIVRFGLDIKWAARF